MMHCRSCFKFHGNLRTESSKACAEGNRQPQKSFVRQRPSQRGTQPHLVCLLTLANMQGLYLFFAMIPCISSPSSRPLGNALSWLEIWSNDLTALTTHPNMIHQESLASGLLVLIPILQILQVSEFLFGDGFAVAPGDKWRVRRRAVAPSLHKAYLETMISKVFGPSGMQLNSKLEVSHTTLAVS